MPACILKAYPSHLVPLDEGALVLRGLIKFKIIGEQSYPILRQCFDLAYPGIEKEKLLAHFDEKTQPAVNQLIEGLLKRRIFYLTDNDDATLRPAKEQPEDIFYWHFTPAPTLTQTLATVKLLLTGNNPITHHLMPALKLAGFNHVSLMDEPPLSLLEREATAGEHDNAAARTLTPSPFQQQEMDCVIALSDTYATERLNAWNKLCFANNWHFFPVTLNNIHGALGPYMIPTETPCYACLTARQQANLSSGAALAALQPISDSVKESINGFHPVMPMVLAGLACMELVKLFTQIDMQTLGRFITINFITQHMQSHPVLRIPNCAVCSNPRYVYAS